MIVLWLYYLSPSGAGKTTISKKIQQKHKILRFQYHTQPENQDQMKLMALIIFF